MTARDLVNKVADVLRREFPIKPPGHWPDNYDEVAREIAGMVVQETQRSRESHNHYFAAVAAAYATLPESEEGRFASAEHMRKWALIQAGYCRKRSFPCETAAEAVLLKAFIQPLDEYAIILTAGNVIEVYTAQSQSEAEMGKKKFQQSKDDVFRILATTLGVPDEVFKTNIGRSA
jgi:hypothetical protein